MKITITPNKTITVETASVDSSDQVLSIIAGLQKDIGPATPTRPDVIQKRRLRTMSPADLNADQYATWSWLVDNDCPGGVHFHALSRYLGISKAAAGCRIRRLVPIGYAARVSSGHYRATEPAAQFAHAAFGIEQDGRIVR